MSGRFFLQPVANPQRVSLNAGLFVRAVEEGLTLAPGENRAASLAASMIAHALFAVIKRQGLTEGEARGAAAAAIDALAAGKFFDPHKEG
jgi:uncharacterized membrane protein YhhN